MPVYNPSDEFHEIQYVDGDFTFTATTPMSGIKDDGDHMMVDELDEHAYSMWQFIFANPSVGLTEMRFNLKFGDPTNGYLYYYPFIEDSNNDGFCSTGHCQFQNGQDGTVVIGTATLRKIGSDYVVILSVASGAYDRVRIELNWQITY